ncbi:MAG TPA: carboxymuconolactone decarboxylase family protein [Rhodopirellula baltica]|uniref:Probable macrophage infectivity potentiator protein Mip n=1 Tax=Rhodopirellula baltica (strain DSM 10527 / NCIMB 13988 / SH1) TaxID=243090 RepID=Q7USN7_RHOBA|nr:carboxymuconolactone decarboxylase family protein [Rhodopirellula baltica]CAD73759.1 probable macrophage infectivity potentiator protein Mip [Rhodopirellula baltica SH 1]HBE64637.1 carboxymuconolactone decarboxylase family protein [Rhodopirellula baltica]
MAYAQPLSINEAPDEAKPILEAIEEKFGQSMNIFSTLAHQPDVLGGMTQINDGLQNDLPAKYRELAYYKASQLNSCDYCSHYHRQAAKKAGLSDQQLDSMNVSSGDLFDEKEQAVLKYAEQLTTKANVDASVVKELKLFLNEKQLVTLAAAVALANFTNRINHGLDIELP